MKSIQTLLQTVLHALPSFRGKHYAVRYLRDRELRARIALYQRAVLNFSFALFKLIAGICYRSIWFCTVAVYHMALCLIRVLLIWDDRKSSHITNSAARLRRGWKRYRFCGGFLLLLSLAITGMTVQTVWQNKGGSYSGLVVYAVAAHTFYRILIAFTRIARKTHAENPVLDAAISIDLSAALVSVFTFQTALSASLGAGLSAAARRLLNAFTGSAVCLALLVLSGFMLLRSENKLQKLS